MRYPVTFIVNYTHKDNLKELAELGDITYSSRVLNVIFLLSYSSSYTIKQVEGVTFVRQTPVRY